MPITMFDDTNLHLIPKNVQAVAGYVNGRWPTYPLVVKQWPKAHHLSIAVTSLADADCLDVEPGDATNAVAASWVKRQQHRGLKRPVIYTSVSNAVALLHALAVVGIKRSDVRLWTAHYNGRQHICDSRCGFGAIQADATQWTNHALHQSLDQSLCSDAFFGTAPVPKPSPKPAPKPAPKPGPVPTPPVGPSNLMSWEDKDKQVRYTKFTKAAGALRYGQYAKGEFRFLHFDRTL